MNYTTESQDPYFRNEEDGSTHCDCDSLCVNPADRPCPKFDESGIATFPVGDPKKMGFRVVDNCCEEHIQ